ncbi:unnamed protein product [Lactuca virosa]|uniref:Uncharacterized protein n=1 Tax=Lactuca virosa TaxID=75947 RepID=A0AAU9MYG8_9ASTR|nr:unnamed protein product [Lactuca virosa]
MKNGKSPISTFSFGSIRASHFNVSPNPESSGRIETFPLIEFINKLSMDEMHSCINRPRSFHYVFLEDQLEMIPFPRRKITSSEDFHGLSFMDVLFNNLSCASPKILAKDYNWKASLHSGKENKQQQWIFW